MIYDFFECSLFCFIYNVFICKNYPRSKYSVFFTFYMLVYMLTCIIYVLLSYASQVRNHGQRHFQYDDDDDPFGLENDFNQTFSKQHDRGRNRQPRTSNHYTNDGFGDRLQKRQWVHSQLVKVKKDFYTPHPDVLNRVPVCILFSLFLF